MDTRKPDLSGVMGPGCAPTDAAAARFRTAARLYQPAPDPAPRQTGHASHDRAPERTPWWNELHLAPVVDAGGRVVQYIGVQTDVTARVEAERRLSTEQARTRQYLDRIEQLAYTDPLTGLPNRRRLQEQVELALWEADASGTALGLLFVDLDGFKAVNDRMGHAAGDELLVEVSRRLRGRLRRRDLLARLGGDEFLVALPGLDPLGAVEEAADVAGSLVEGLGRPVDLRGEVVVVRASVGAAVSPADGSDFATLLHTADLRMYEAKKLARAAAATPSVVQID
ncbi:MAG: hypothetical protein JWQ53_242 [Klenkia sp.]|nr:hypothetical protein [Klenkia sp.]